MKIHHNEVIVDPTERFQHEPNVAGVEKGRCIFNGYDRETGLFITWHEMSLQTLSPGQIDDVKSHMNYIKTIKSKSINNLIHYWIDEKRNTLIFVTEASAIGSLEQLVYSDRLCIRPVAVSRWFYGVVAALDHLSSLNPPVAHRRIHVNSVFLKMSTGNVKIRIPLPVTTKSYDLAYWMPPESLQGVFNNISDIWCVGIAALETLTGLQPYSECKTPGALIKALIDLQMPKSLDLVTDENAYDFITQCLQYIDDRPSAADLLLHPFLHENEFSHKKINLNKNTEDCVLLFESAPNLAENGGKHHTPKSHRRVSMTMTNTLSAPKESPGDRFRELLNGVLKIDDQ